jgi:DNA processing protein
VDEYRRHAQNHTGRKMENLFERDLHPDDGRSVSSENPASVPAVEQLGTQEKKVFILLGSDPLHVDEIAGESGLTPMEVSSIVLHLELQGLAKALPGARYIRV